MFVPFAMHAGSMPVRIVRYPMAASFLSAHQEASPLAQAEEGA